MLLVDTYLDRSSIHGVGVFAAQNILKDALIWEFHPAIDRMISAKEFTQLPQFARKMVKRHAEYLAGQDMFMLSGDNDKYMNHADEPNTRNEGRQVFAAMFIPSGTEITCDYRSVTMLDFDFSAARR